MSSFCIVGFNNRQTKMGHGPVGLPNFGETKLEENDICMYFNASEITWILKQVLDGSCVGSKTD